MTGRKARRWVRALRWSAAALWAGCIAAGSLLPSAPAADRILPVSHADLVLHVLLYGTLALLLALLVGPGARRLCAGGLGAFAFGLLLECLQPLTGRAFDARDLAANAAGALLGAAVASLLPHHGSRDA